MTDANSAHLDPFAFVGSLATTMLRAGAGIATQPRTSRPALLFELYEFEGCPFCRIVREVLTELDLDAMVYPCPKGGTRFRPELLKLGGKEQFPFLRDPTTGRAMYESADIVKYLFETYGGGTVPLRWQAMGAQQLGSAVAGMWRFGAGRRVRPSKASANAPRQPLELYRFEGSPCARLVRERLCELEIPYILRSMGRSTAADWLPPRVRDALQIQPEPATLNRKVLLEHAGRITVPYLVDPNAGVELGEAAAIIEHLQSRYGA
jgi:glutathione S-transferase